MTEMRRHTIQEATDVSSARRDISGLTAALGYDETRAGQVAIIVTELAQNMLRHAGGGELLAGPDEGDPGGIEILALDRGPGIIDVAQSLRDGFSTGGTSGNGLGAVRRLSREMLFHVEAARGTAILVRTGGTLPKPPRRPAAALCVAKPGETACGDAAAIRTDPDGTVHLLLADGLGHGPDAARASGMAARAFLVHDGRDSSALLAGLHASLRSTRGAALAAARIADGKVTYGGIGNIAGLIVDSGGVRRMVSHSGTAGHVVGRIQVFEYPLFSTPVLVMFSDGLTSTWSPDGRGGLFGQDPMLIAGVLYRDHNRGRDDASVVVWKG
ncbi:MAG TPA: SpoIIE family protein phosphatase [Rhodopila sp.]|uniref:SpoIIE family protein phosphatase n=1 Tax=Rhodopila sp. TaxID=2480087 RepID=UPI002C8F9077|nr:SpoIIE family protein phosphatase [Rhodopila sp.]HVY17080.1 SpoIIE family protein phosphatase [Rhodopila sp.]